MHTERTREQFVELRAQGWSLRHLASELHVGQRTLVDWNRRSLPRDQVSESITCRSMIGVWKRETVGLPSEAVPKLVVAADAVADCDGPYPGMLKIGNA